ncbi:MAG: SdpI family protein [Bacillota bacterium]
MQHRTKPPCSWPGPQTPYTGIRTPWTLTDEETWRITHRVNRHPFMAAGGVTRRCSGPCTLSLPHSPGGQRTLLAGLSMVLFRAKRARISFSSNHIVL